MKDIFKNYFESFTGSDSGYMRRKLMAFFGMWTAAAMSWKYCDITTINYIVTAWLLFSLLCAGLVVMQDIIKLKNGSNESNENKSGGN